MIDNSSFPIIGGGCESINLFCGCVEGLGRLGSAHRWWGFKEIYTNIYVWWKVYGHRTRWRIGTLGVEGKMTYCFLVGIVVGVEHAPVGSQPGGGVSLFVHVIAKTGTNTSGCVGAAIGGDL